VVVIGNFLVGLGVDLSGRFPFVSSTEKNVILSSPSQDLSRVRPPWQRRSERGNNGRLANIRDQERSGTTLKHSCAFGQQFLVGRISGRGQGVRGESAVIAVRD